MTTTLPDTEAWKMDIVRCPISGERLVCVTPQLIAQLNRLAADGRLLTRAGEVVKPTIIAGLSNASSQWFYRQENLALLLMSESAIEIPATA